MTRPSLGLAVGDGNAIANELAAALEVSAREIGLDVSWVGDARTASERAVVLGVGYADYYPWLARPLPATARVSWLGEPLPPADETRGARVLRMLPMGRIVDGISAGRAMAGTRQPSIRLTDWRERAAYDHDRRVNLASHRRAAAKGIRIVVTSADRQESLRRAGIESTVVPFGYHAVLAGPPRPIDDDDRDIDVLVLAASASGLPTRRVRLLSEVISALGPGVRVEVIEGGAWGDDRHRLLGRARIVLNIHRVPGNFTGIRTVLVGAAGATLVSEPVDTPAPFVPGLHYIEADARELASVVRDTLLDRPRRLAIAGNLQRFLVEELTMGQALGTVLDAVS